MMLSLQIIYEFRGVFRIVTTFTKDYFSRVLSARNSLCVVQNLLMMINLLVLEFAQKKLSNKSEFFGCSVPSIQLVKA